MNNGLLQQIVTSAKINNFKDLKCHGKNPFLPNGKALVAEA